MEKFKAHKVALVTLVLMCSGMATASSGRPPAPTRPAPAIPQAPDSPRTALARTRAELETTRRRLATAETALATEQAKRRKLEEGSRNRRNENAANCLEDECPHAKRAYWLEKELIQTKSDYSKGESKKVQGLNRQLIAARAAKQEILNIPGVAKAIEKHRAKSSNTESPLKKIAETVREVFSSEPNTDDSLVKPSRVERLKNFLANKHDDTPPDFQ